MNKKIFLLIAFFFSFILSYGQVASSYCFAPVNGAYVPLAGTTNVLGLTFNKDDGFSSIFPLDATTPFNFVFGGASYSQIQVSSNGLLSFKNTAISETFYGKTAADISDRKPFLAPLWDDLRNTNVPRYVVTGSAPNRIFKIEWSGQKWNFQSSANVISFQVWLYETSNIIEYIYNQGTANINGVPSATIGIYDAAGTYLTLSNSSTNPTASSSAFTTSINSKPANGQIYRFTPNVTTPGSISGASNQCRSSSGTYSIAPVANAVSYTWTTTGTGWTITPASNGLSVSIAFNASATTGDLRVSATNGCGTSTNSIFNVQLNTPPGTPIVGTYTPPTCAVLTGSVALSGLLGTWTINASPNTPGLTGLTGSINNTIIGGLAQGTSYTFTASDATCTSMPTAPVVVGNVETITSSDGVNWTSAPTISKIGIITAPSVAPVTITSDTELCSCTISPNTNVEVASGVTLRLQDKLTVNGSLTFKNNASLVQINEDPTINSGNITYQRETVTAVDKFDYTYWSSPVSPQTLYNVSPNTLTDKYMSFDAVTNNWILENSVTKVMEPGVGYSIRGPQNHYAPNPINPHRANFFGVPHNGTIPVSITATDASYLLGNPYPSALDADLFLQGNDLVIDGTIYFWTHNTDIAPSGSNYIYDSDDYASYNLTGGASTGTGIPAASDVNPVPTIPTGKIASGQGFFATSIAPGTVNFTNTMRLGGNVNSEFFRSNSKSKKNASFEKNRLWLNFSNTEGAFKQTLIGYVTGATNDYERTFDGISFDGNTFVDFYSVLEDKNFVIQGRALPFVQSDLVTLGYKTTIAGKFTISIFQTDGFLTTQNVFLEDKMLNVIHNLKEASYDFTTEKGTFDDRFVLRYTDKTLGTGNFESEDKTIVVFKEKNELKIKSEFETMKRVTIFDLLGKKVFEETLKDVNEFRTSKITLKNQIVIVKVVLTNGQIVTKKVSY